MIGSLVQAKVAEIRALKEAKGQIAAILGVVTAAGAVAVFYIMLTVIGSIKAGLNLSMYDSNTQNLLNLIPLVLVSAVIVAIVFGALLAVLLRS